MQLDVLFAKKRLKKWLVHKKLAIFIIYFIISKMADVAQLVEQLIRNQ